MRVQTVKVDDDVRAVLAQALEQHPGGNVLKLVGQLDRKLYQRTDLVLNAAGGRWQRKLGGHVFEADPRAKIEEALGGELVDEKKTRQAFYTPPDLAAQMVDLLVWGGVSGEDLTVLEPSAGDGALVRVLLKRHPRTRVNCVEIDTGACQQLRQSLGSAGGSIIEGDFLRLPLSGRPTDYAVDAILMNPPWTQGQDVEHVAHAWPMLKEGGRLIALVSPSAVTRQGRKWETFQRIYNQNLVHEEMIPPGAFKDSGTMVGAHLIVLQKGD